MMQYFINITDCNVFELDMISNAKIEGLLMPKKIEITKNEHYLLIYDEPKEIKTLNELTRDNFFDPVRFHDFLSNIIKLKNRLETYMLNTQNLQFKMDEIWYDPVVSAYRFIYLPKNNTDSLQELNLYRHIFFESSKIFEENVKHIHELRESSFDLNRFCTLLKSLNTNKRSRGVWKNLFTMQDRSHIYHDSKTIQKSRKSCLLDALDPTIFHEIYFNHITIGRSDECNIQIADPSISRRHAIICKKKMDYTLEDLDSNNGTFHNGKVVNKTVLLVNGDKLQFGDKEFIFIL